MKLITLFAASIVAFAALFASGCMRAAKPVDPIQRDLDRARSLYNLGKRLTSYAPPMRRSKGRLVYAV